MRQDAGVVPRRPVRTEAVDCERLSGKGIVTALNMATGVPIFEIEPALGILVAAILAVGILPAFRKTEKDKQEKPSNLDSFQVDPISILIACFSLPPWT